jgi:predicted ATPase
MIFAGAVSVTQGFSAAALVQNLSCAQVLCQALHDDATLVSVLVALGRFYDLRADRDTIEQQTDEKLRLLGRVQEPTLALQLHTHLGTSYLFRGMHKQAQAHHAQALELYDPQQHRELALRFSVDPAVVAGVLSSWSLWLAGWPDRARVRLQYGLNRARELGHPYSLCLACVRAAEVHLWCGALAEVERLVEEGRSLAREHGVALFSVQGGILQAYVRVQRGESEAGLSLLTEGVAQYRGLGAPDALPSHLCFVAEAYRQLGRVEEGLATVAEAVRLTETQADVWWAAEVYRLQGELLLMPTGQATTSRRVGHSQSRAGRDTSAGTSSQSPLSRTPAEAEERLHQALGIARQQEAKSLELRAVMSLSRLWHAQGKKTQAQLLLAEVYGWFTEGFDTTDLREAQALLAALV